MKMRVLTSTSVFLFLLACLAHTAAAITMFGQHPFHQSPLTSVEQMKAMFEENKDDVREGLKKAGMPEMFEPLMAQLPGAEVTTVKYRKGTKLQWMFFKRNGKGSVRVDKDVIWESDEPFTGYEFFIDFNDMQHTFVVPLACGNLALSNIGPIPKVVVAPVPPTLKPEPVKKAQAPVSPPPVAASPLAFVLDAGYLYQTDPAHHLFLRGGIEYDITENISALGMIGAAPKVEGNESRSAYMIDAMLNYNWDKAFVGVGFGAWLTGGDSDLDTEDNGFDVIFDAGYQIYEKPDKFKILGFIELRSSVDEMSDFDMYGRVGGGLRFVF